MTTGIYSIYFESIDKIYIGQSQNIEQRFTSHKSLLKRGHPNYKLAEAYSLDQEPIYSILLICPISELDNNEIQLIEEFKSVSHGLNIAPGGESENYGYFSGRCKHTQEELEKVFDILCDPNLTISQIVEISGIHKVTISSICTGVRHLWLHEKFPEKSIIVKANKFNRFRNAQENRFKTNAILISPQGIEFTCFNASKFADEHHLNRGHLSGVIRGSETQHKGWKLKEGGINNE
jgi:hypothetical protein